MNRPRSILPALKTGFLAPLERFFRIEAASGVVLLAAAAVALFWANSQWPDSYRHLWHASIPLGIGRYSGTQSLHFWINDGLMTVFFLLVGLEIRREMHAGALSSLRLAALPLAAALGGIIAPALIYSALNTDAQSRQGWAVPTATDIAFAIGVLVLLGKRVPAQLRILLLALAIIDDIVAILIIAFVYSDGIDSSGLLIAAAGVFAVWLLRKLRLRSAGLYVLSGLALWAGLLQAGIHPTLAGVLLGLMTPVVSAERLSNLLHPWVAFGIMPLFALANAGVNFSGFAFGNGPASSVPLGIFIGLVVGKPLGILLASFLGVRLGLCELPERTTWRGIFAVGCLGGIGFTMAIFIANLAFAEHPELLVTAKLAVLGASLTSAAVGLWVGRQLLRDDAAIAANVPPKRA